ncbi:hydroxyisourate hydrolase [Intrasporangium sp.]|uniref:hydroxyisourate hydrolase n=1 Tax=Intrasporangium sp. TaxID=1925024 RepID=UPI00293ADAF3|nr:hydroxyisourate hydrolase [Intrasporangium sp.]MDV3221554.1 hydroxyisourate hydrolase [Intrasporangium sp.]
MSAVTTHVLDTALGRPAEGVPVRLELMRAASDTGPRGVAHLVASAVTDADGRIGDLGPDRVAAGTYRLVFDTAAYFTATGQIGFFPEITVAFALTDPEQHHHVPVLLSPFAYSTYRGS